MTLPPYVPLPILESQYYGVRIEWVNCGEGWSGDYNPDDPEDTNLLRFDISVLSESGEWEDPGDASYCTRVPADTDSATLTMLLGILMRECESDVAKGSYKKTLERLSWIDQEGNLP